MKKMTLFTSLTLILNQLLPAQSAVSNFIQIKEGFSKSQIDTIFAKTKDFPNEFQASIAVIKGGTVRYFGVRKQLDSLESIENHKSVFEIGSISKVFTASLLAHEVVAGKINLTQSIQDKLPVVLKNQPLITFQQLANHTSGLPRLSTDLVWEATMNFENPYKGYSGEKLEKLLTNSLVINQIPGEKYDYSNLGMGLLGYILSKSKQNTYQQILQDTVFLPLNMVGSTTDRSQIKGELVIGLNAGGKKTSNWDFDAIAGAGAILSTVEDLSKFAIANLEGKNKAFLLTQTPTFTINEKMQIGLGWHLIKTKTGDTWHWHNGGTGGYTSSMAIDISSGTGVVVLSNISAFHKKMGNIDSLCFELMKSLKL